MINGGQIRMKRSEKCIVPRRLGEANLSLGRLSVLTKKKPLTKIDL